MIRSILLLVAAAALPGHAAATIERSLEPVYASASQYTAVLLPKSGLWRLMPLDGGDFEVRSEPCPHSTQPARGLWLIGRDADGRPELVAVSATPLPAGHAGRVALRACDDPALNDGSRPAYGVPGALLAMLAETSGAVLVDE
jgi:hypothetical protein